MRLVILGGGGFRVPLIYRAIASRAATGPMEISDVVLYDRDAARLAVIRSVIGAPPVTAPSGAAPGRPRVAVTTDLDEAIRGADVVFSAIRVGGAAGRAADERRALDAGVLGQETVGAGGLAFGLRTVPVALRIARRIAELAPQAWTINFTNPAGMITEAMRGELGERVIGICDSPVGLIRRACRALGADAATAAADYAGINHLGWLRALRADGEDLLPGLIASDMLLASFEEGRLFPAALLRALGCLPNEYLAFYYGSRDLAASLSTARTRGEYLAAQQEQFYRDAAVAAPGRAGLLWAAARMRREESYLAETRRDGQERDESDLSGGGYEHVAVDLVSALHGGGDKTLIVNAPNGAALPQLPADMVIEVPCVVNEQGARPLPASPLTLHQLGLVAAVRASERAVIDAVVRQSRDLAFGAFATHPLVGSPRIAAALLDGVLSDHPQLADLLR